MNNAVGWMGGAIHYGRLFPILCGSGASAGDLRERSRGGEPVALALGIFSTVLDDVSAGAARTRSDPKKCAVFPDKCGAALAIYH